MTSIPEHLSDWQDSSNWNSLPHIAVIGATGRIGQALRAVWKPDWPVTWLGRSRGSVRCDPVTQPLRFADLTQNAKVFLVVAGPAPGGTLTDTAALGDHAALAKAVAEIAGNRPVLLASSAAVYGRAGIGGAPLGEEIALPADLSPYGAAKRDMEAAAPAATALRIGNIAGLDAILGGWRPGFTLDEFADGSTPRRSYIGPGSLALGLAALCCLAHDLPRRLNIAEPGHVSMGALLEAAGLDFETRPAPKEAIPDVTLDVSALVALVPRLSDPVSETRLVAEAQWLSSCLG